MDSGEKWVVDSIPWSQLHKGFKDSWNLSLNLCSLKWLKPRRSRVISLIALGLWQLYTELAAGLKNWRIFFLTVKKRSELWRLGSNLFHSEIEDGKKELCTFLVVCGARLTGIKWKRYSGCCFFKFFWKRQSFLYQRGKILNLILDIIFLSIYP